MAECDYQQLIANVRKGIEARKTKMNQYEWPQGHDTLIVFNAYNLGLANALDVAENVIYQAEQEAEQAVESEQ